jgi:hypothetical protein
MTEAVSIVLWVPAHHGDKGEHEEHEDQDDLAAREPELCFTKDLDCDNIE